MERVVVTQDEIAQSGLPAEEVSGAPIKLPPPIPLWARVFLAPFVLVLPLLCLVTLILRIATRTQTTGYRLAWVSYLSTLLAISGVLTSIATVVLFSAGPTPLSASQGLSELDSRTSFPALPEAGQMTAEEVSADLKPLVTVITPVHQNRFFHVEEPSNALGAGVLLQATPKGYLIATARHVVEGEGGTADIQRALVASISGVWAGADVVAQHQTLDLLLLWLPRTEGKAAFVLPVAPLKQVIDGEPISVIGHPQGLRYTLSTGIVSRKDQDVLQLSAPVSPGNSGGPVFDSHGRLAGIVTSMVDKNHSPNAENLNFAVRADALLDSANWKFFGKGQSELASFQQAQNALPAQEGEPHAHN
jgi:S1-C subfamily serine protease